MAVIRNRHNAKNQFVVLDQKTLWDENLSLKAVGLWGRCISRPDNWSFNISEMSKNGKEGERAIYSAIRELKDANLCVFMQHRIKGEKDGRKINRIHKTEYFFFQVPLTEEEKEKFIRDEEEEFKLFLQDGGFVDVAFVDVGNDGLTNTYSNKNREETTNAAVDSTSKSEKHPHPVLEKIGIDGKQFGRLKKDFSEEELEKGIAMLQIQSKFIENPYGWLKSCIKQKWYDKSNDREVIEERNKEIAGEIERFCEGKLHPQCKIEQCPSSLVITRGIKTIEIPYLDRFFAEKAKSLLEKMEIKFEFEKF